MKKINVWQTACFKDEHNGTSYFVFFYNVTPKIPIKKESLTLFPLTLGMTVTASKN